MKERVREPHAPEPEARSVGGPEILAQAALVAAGGEVPEGGEGVCRDIGWALPTDREELLARLDAVLVGRGAAAALVYLEGTGALALLLPEVQALVGFHTTCRVHHKDLWGHTLEVLDRTAPDPDLRWVALMHDVGKIATRHVDPSEQVSFLRHERVGAWLMAGVGARLAMPAARIERIAFVIEHHARVNAYGPSWTDRAVRRLVRESGDRLADLLAFAGADYTTRRSRKKARIRAHLEELRRRIEALAAEDAAARALPRGLGSAICEALGLDPGPEVGRHIAWLRAEVLAGRLDAGADVDVYVEALRAAQNG